VGDEWAGSTTLSLDDVQPHHDIFMPRLQATVPEGASSNALLRVRLPDGQDIKVRVPEGLVAGDEFQFEVSSLGEIKTTVARRQSESSHGGGVKAKSKNPKKKRHNHHHHAENHSKTTHPRVNGTPLFIAVCLDVCQKLYQTIMYQDDDEDDLPVANPQSRIRGNQRGPIDQKNMTGNEKMSILNYLGISYANLWNGGDFCLALALGMLIGSCIVLGFLAGVLWVTPVSDRNNIVENMM
jgi:hypothetical protein